MNDAQESDLSDAVSIFQLLASDDSTIAKKAFQTTVSFLQQHCGTYEDGKSISKAISKYTKQFVRFLSKKPLKWHKGKKHGYSYRLLRFCDFRYYFLKALSVTVENDQNLMKVFLILLKSIPLDSMECVLDWTAIEGKQYPFTKTLAHKKLFGKVISQILAAGVSPNLTRQLLLNMTEKIIPNVENPKLLADFLFVACNADGLTRLLSLSGIFVVMQQYGLEYPNFYTKLYSLVSYDSLTSVLRPKLMPMLDLFLQSSYLPGYLVSAFIKKLARLCLGLPADAVLLLVPFICNLLIRHPSCQILINRTDLSSISSDPFDEHEADPSKSRATESSLWEISSLKSHYFPRIALWTQKFDSPLPIVEEQISDLQGVTLSSLLNDEFDMKFGGVHLEISEPRSLFDE